MTTPLVTVLMSVYNGEAYLSKAVESILTQTYQHFEFLIIDDASTDRSAQVLSSYPDERIRVIRNETNLGLTRSLNKGLALAQGKYIARMDADDVSYPQRLEKQVDFMEAHAEVGLCGSWALDRKGETLRQRIFSCNEQEIRFSFLRYNPFVHSSVMLRAAILQEHRLEFDPDFLYAQDYELWIRIANYTKLANLPEFLVQYRIHDQQITIARLEQQEACVRQAIRSQLKKLHIDANEEELTLHNSIFNRVAEQLDKHSILQGYRWLMYLLQQNDRHLIYEPTYFFLKLEECWVWLLYLVPVLNQETVSLIIASPFRIFRLSRLTFSIKLIVRFIYYKIFY